MNADKKTRVLLRNNTGNKPKEELIDEFVVRTRTFENLFKEVKESVSDKPEQNYIIIGQRGAGKTTLLYRLKYAIEDDEALKERIIPIMFFEEQYYLTVLEDLWENIANHLEGQYKWTGLVNEMEKFASNAHYEDVIVDILEKRLKEKKRKIIVFIENINVFLKKIDKSGQKKLREVLLQSNYIRIIGSATSYFNEIVDYDYPFYNFFKILQLEGLSKEECINLLRKIGELYGEEEQINTIIETNPNRIESLRRLTGGLPRTISYLFQIFLDNKDGKAIKDLYQLIDTLTFLYKSELDQLSPQQQRVIDVIAKNWDAISAKEIAKKSKYESKKVSSILNVLEKDQLVETISTKTKNNLYRIRERFLNIWYLMRFGRNYDKDNIIWLVRFYDIWCDQSELAQHIDSHINNLKEGNYDVNAAVDMGNTFLTCENVSEDLKYNLYEATKSYLPRNYIQSLKTSDDILYKEINGLVKKKTFEQAIEVLESIETKDKKYYEFAGFLYSRTNQLDKSEQATEELYKLNPEDGKIAFRLGYLNYKLNNSEKAIVYLQKALDEKEYKAASMLGDIESDSGDMDKAIAYHKIAVENGETSSLMSLATIYFRLGDLDKSASFSKEAIKEGHFAAYNNLGIIYQRQNQHKKAITVLEKASNKGINTALINLGISYTSKRNPDFEKARNYFEHAIDKGLLDAYYYLGRLYVDKLDRPMEGIKQLMVAIENGSTEAAHFLGHWYHRKKDFLESDKYFLKAFDMGRDGVILCYTNALFTSNREDRKEYALDFLESNWEVVDKIGAVAKILYCQILLWNDKIEKSIIELNKIFVEIESVFNEDNEDKIGTLLGELTDYFIFLIAKGQYNAANSLFKDDSIVDFKQTMKPVYYALMNVMKPDFPDEYLKAGQELKDTVTEVTKAIEFFKNKYV